MYYYKITLPEKTYVARGLQVADIINEFVEAFGVEDANQNDHDREFFAVEPLRDTLTVKGEEARKVLESALIKHEEELKQVYADLLKENDLETANDIMDEEFGNPIYTVIILEADPEPDPDLYLVGDTLVVKTGNKVMPLAELENVMDINI